jgi:hypothetical protein
MGLVTGNMIVQVRLRFRDKHWKFECTFDPTFQNIRHHHHNHHHISRTGTKGRYSERILGSFTATANIDFTGNYQI